MAMDSVPPLEAAAASLAGTESPRHGFQGDRTAAAPAALPASLSVSISREAGSRGASIAKRVGRKLGWQVYNQELLDYIAQEGTASPGVLANLPQAAVAWADERLERLLQERKLSKDPAVLDLARVVLAVGAQGEAVLVGRGAGYILPRETTLHVRIIAPLPDRVAYMSQWLRLTMDAAGDQVRQLDARRAEFLRAHFRHDPGDVYQYDLLLNSSLLGEEACVALIAQAARAKLAAAGKPAEGPPWA